MARGSVLELQTQLVISEKLGFGQLEHIKTVQDLAEQTGKMLWALMEKL